MRIRNLLLLCTLGLLPSAASAAPVLVHQPPVEAEAGKPLPLSATITDAASPVAQVSLYYRSIGGLSYREEIMQGAGVSYSAQVPASSVTEDGLEYYLEARNQAGERGTSPLLNPSTAPHRVLVRRPAKGPELELLFPDDGATLTAEEAMVVVRIDSGASQTDLASLKVVFDETDVTASVEKTPTLLTFVPPANLAPGLHGLQVTVRNAEGKESKSPTWSFTVSTPEAAAAWKAEQEAAAKLAAFRGNLRAEMQYTSLGKKPADTLYLAQPEGWLHRVNLNFSGGSEAWQFLGTGYLTSEEAPGRQPVNRFRLDVVNPALAVSLGDTYPVFTDFTLNNSFIRGGYLRWTMGDASQAHSELHLAGGWNLLPIEGRDPDTAGTFERLAGGFRWLSDLWPGIGFSLNADAIVDSAQSITQIAANPLPENNVVASAEGHIKINYLPDVSSLLYGEYGLGYYDQNMNFFTISLGDAYRGGMRWEWNHRNAVEVEYKRTSSKFVTLGNPWLLSDWQGVDSNARLYFFDDQLILLGEVNVWQDNVDGQKTQDFYLEAANTTVTAGTTNTLYVSGMAYYRLPPYLSTVSLGYSVNSQKDNSAPAPIIDNRTSVFSLGLGTQIPAGADQLLANLSYSLSTFQDLAQTRLSGDLTTGSLQASLVYAFGAWAFSAGYGLNSTLTDESGYTGLTLIQAAGATRQTLNYSLYSLRGNWKAVPGVFDLGLSWDNLVGKDDLNVVDDALSTVALYGTYYIRSGHSLGLTLSNIGYADNRRDDNSYQELVANLLYNLNF